jgi:radical SAM protein with 4Fe4S-binding SPASM domain
MQILVRKYKIPTRVARSVLKIFGELEDEGFITSNVIEGKAIELNEIYPPLNFVALRLTNRCNLRCKHCFLGEHCFQEPAESSGEKELSTYEIKNLLDHLSALKVLGVTFTGGEPLLRKDFFDLVFYAEEKDIPLYIFTNGTLVGDDEIKKLRNLRNLVYVMISLDGTTAKTHDYIRGKGNYAMTISLVKKLISNKIPVCIDSCINKVNFHEYKEFLPLCSKLGVNAFHPAPIAIEGRARKHESQLALTLQQKLEIMTFYSTIASDSEKIIVGEILGGEVGRRIFGTIFPREVIRCSVGSDFCMIWPNGDVIPCRPLYSLGIKAGNIREKPLLEIWKSSKVFKFLRNLSVDKFKKCRACEYRKDCGGGCRARAYNYYKDWLAPDPEMCKWRERRAQDIAKVHKRLYGA